MALYPQILSAKQEEILAKLGFLTGTGLYLAGGTALALQLGHRTSLDFDFYSATEFSNQKLTAAIAQNFPQAKSSESLPANTFQTEIDEVNISVFYYPYVMLDPLIEYSPIKLASLRDLAAMKIAAIVQRARQRDFVDIYYLMEALNAGRIVEAAFEKFPWYLDNSEIVYRSLTYFDEANLDKEANRIVIIDKKVNWEIVKKEVAFQIGKLKRK